MNLPVLRYVGPGLLAVAALVTLVVGLLYGGGAAPLALADPGPVVRWGLPVAELAVNLSAAGMVGTLVLALFALRPGQAAFDSALDLSSASAAVFTIASGATGYLSFLNALNPNPSIDAQFGQQLGRFLIELDVGRSWLVTTVVGAVLTVLIFIVRSWTPTLLVTVLAAATLVPMALQGHSGDEANHNTAVMSLLLHILGAAVWMGGLLALVILRPQLRGEESKRVVQRYSSLALAAFIVVAGSGVVRALAGLSSLTDLVTPYGALLIGKVIALGILGAFGAWYRRRLLTGIGSDGRFAFWNLVGVELAIMGIASGLAVALSRTPPPVNTSLSGSTSPAVYLTGAPLPPELTPMRWLTAWELDPIWTCVVGFAAFFYLAGVHRLRHRGDAWPAYRTVLWLFGLLLLVWVTGGAVNVYQDYLFSVHMVGHMLLTMAIPMCLVFGAPVTLAARAIHRRTDGTRGGREWILWAVHTPFARVVTHPIVAAAIFIASLWIFYYTDLFRWSLYDHLWHEWMIVHFLISGYLFVQSLVGIDPVPLRLPYALRLVTLIAVMALHAFFGIAIMAQTGLMVAEWFGSMGRTWGATPLEDQYTGGGIAWSVGEIPTLILAVTVAVQWARSDARQQRRADRHADRTGDRELEEYNARLAALADRDRS